MKRLLFSLMLLMALFTTQVATAQVTSNPQVITDLLNRIGGSGAAGRFETAINTGLDGEKFIISSLNSKPYIEGSNAIAVATGINWYLNHVANINLTWNKLSTDLVGASLPLPAEAIEKTSAVDIRYYLNYCTYSYTCAMWTEERWMQEIDWMALHGINMPLMLVGLDCVWYDLYTEKYGYTAEEISNYIAGPAFQAWWGMINCEGHGGPNPAWWYDRSRALAKNMLARMRAYGMEPVLPGFCGEVPSNLGTKLGGDSEINTGGWWQGFPAPGLMGHKSANWETLASNFYEALENVMGTSKYYSMDPFHEGATGLTGNSSSDVTGYFQSCYAQMKANVGEDVVWVAQDWGDNPRSTMLSGLNKGELLVLDLFAESDPHYSGGYNGHDYVYCMLLNFGGRVGLHGRFNKVIDGYYAAMQARGDQMVGIGATPEGAENNPMLYDILFELPWRETAPDKTEWINNYTVSRYGADNDGIKAAYAKLMQSVYNCTTSQQGTSEPVICAIPNLSADRVSTWATAAVDYDHEIVIAAADGMLAEMGNFASTNDNFNYDLLDVVRQSLTNYALDFLGQLNSDYSATGFDATFSARKDYYLALIEDIDRLLGTHQKFRLGNWAEMARAIVTETAAANSGAGETDADWLEYDNLRRQITTWADFQSSLRDYSNREWQGLVKDYYLERWKIYFDALEAGTASSLNDSYWYNYGNTYVYDDEKTYTAEPEGDTKTIASEVFNKYFFSHTDAEGTKVYFNRHLEQSKTADEYVKYAFRGENFTFEIPDGTTATMSIDANNDGTFSDGETVSSNTMAIPADAATTTVKALVVLSDNTEISFNIFVADNITDARTVTVQAGDNGTVAIVGADGTSVTNTDYVTMTATGNSGYEFSHWVQVADDATETEVSRNTPFTYLGKADATFKAYFIQNIWGIPGEDWSDRSDIETKQYLTSITYTQGESTNEIYTASSAPETLFVPVGNAISAAKGSQFTLNWQGDGNMKFGYLSAYIDLNKDGDFNDDDELLMVKGTLGAQNAAVETGPLTILLPYDMPLGTTHIRLRFDGAWKTGYDATTKAFPASNTLNRRCYEIVLNVTEYAATTSHIVILSNNEEWGTVRNITGVTGVDIDVPSGTEICMDAFPKEGYQFVHWLDKYGRVASTDANFYYTPVESGEFTAVFKKIAQETVEIDGWEFRIRTQPGTEAKTRQVARGEALEDGKTYYIYAYPKQGNTDTYTARYLYDNNGALATAEAIGATGYLWTCTVNNDDTYSFQNETGNYLANNTSYHICIEATSDGAKYTLGDPKYSDANNVTYSLCNATDGYEGSKYMVTKYDGSAFDKVNQSYNNGTWCADYVFVEYYTPADVVLTEVVSQGDADLDIPATVTVDGDECKIIGFDNGLFNNNKDLLSISLPNTMEFLGSNVVFTTSVKGTNTPTSSGDDNPDAIVQLIDLGENVLMNNEAWEIRVAYESDGVSTYNQWGSPLLYAGSEGSGNELFYLSNVNGWSSCWHVRAPFALGNDYFKEHTNTKISTFIAAIENLGTGKALVKVTNSEGATQTSDEVTFSTDNISAFSARLPKGLNITNFEVIKGEVPCAFSGCSNLDAINVAAGGATYSSIDGCLYNANGTVLLCTPEGKEKGADRRALGELIEKMQALTAQIGTFNASGKSTEIALTTTESENGYIWCNAPQSEAEGVGKLLDDDDNTFLHTTWGNNSMSNGDHYIAIDLGAGNELSKFKFFYKTRTGTSQTMNFADIPNRFVVYGCNEKDGEYVQLADFTGLSQSSGHEWTSTEINSDTPYRFLRFNGYTTGTGFWAMAKFELYKVGASADLIDKYDGTELTDAFAAKQYDVLLDAINVYDNGTTAAQMQAAATALDAAITALEEKMALVPEESPEHPELTALIGNFEELIGKIAEVESTVSNNIPLQVDNSNAEGYIYSNATIAEGNLNNLLDDDNESYIHTAWSGNTADGLNHYLRVYLGENPSLSDFTFSYVTRNNYNTEKPKQITVAGCATVDGEYTTIATITDLPSASATTFNSDTYNAAGYKYLRFMVDDTYRDLTDGNSHKAYSMAKLVITDCVNTYTKVDVAFKDADYTTLRGITNAGVATAYTALQEAIATNASGTADDKEAAYQNLKALYDALDAKLQYMPEGVYNINFGGQPVFVGYSTDTSGNSNTAGYKLIDPTSGHITDVAQADALFTITHNGLGYSLSAQGKYLKNPHTSGWHHIMFSDDKAEEGRYMFDEVETSVYKLFSAVVNNNQANYVNDYGNVFGNDKKGTASSTFTLTKVTEYAVTIPASGSFAVCLPFNVVLPEGVTANDVVTIGDNANDEKVYETTLLASAGGKIAAGTPVILKGTAETMYNLAITLDDADAVGAAGGSLLRGNFVKQSLAVSDDVNRYTFADATFTRITDATDIAANSVWMELVDEIDAIPEGTIDTSEPFESVELEDGAIYRIKGRLSTGDLRTLYTDGGNRRILWTTDETKTDATTLFIAQKDEEAGTVKLVSAVGNGYWSEGAQIEEEGTELTLKDGSVSGTAMIVCDVDDKERRFCVDGDNLDYYSNSGNATAGAYVGESTTTDFVFEKVTDATVSYTFTMKNSSNWGTLYLPFAVTVPGDLVAYIAHTPNVTGKTMALRPVTDGIIPAKTPVVIGRSEAVAASSTTTTGYEFEYTTETPTVDTTGNVLAGCFIKAAVEESGKNCYVLLTVNTKDAFYWIYKEYNASSVYVGSASGTHFICSANKAYLAVDASTSAVSYSFTIEGTTGIEDVDAEEGGATESIFDLQGRRLNEITEPGIYIVNGKKVIVK